MNKARLALLISGVGWIVFYTGSFMALGSSFPTIESTGQEVVDWFTDSGRNAQVYAWTAAFAALTLTVFGESGFIAPGGAMNLYLGGVLGMAWVIGVIVWSYQRLASPDSA